jgi:hypothetical protein
VTSGGRVVRFAPAEVAEPGSLRGDKTSAAMSECRSRPRASTPLITLSSRCVSAEMVGGEVASVMRKIAYMMVPEMSAVPCWWVCVAAKCRTVAGLRFQAARDAGEPEGPNRDTYKQQRGCPSRLPAHEAHTVFANHRDAVPGRRLPGCGYG